MSSPRNLIIIFALILLLLVGGVILLGNPAGTTTNSALSEIQPILEQANVNVSDVEQCIQNEEPRDTVNASLDEGRAFGFTGTPAVILLNKDTKLGVMLKGNYPIEIVRNVINGLKNEELPEGIVLYDAPEEEYKLVSQKIENVSINDEDNYRGNKEAKIQLIEYSDYDCQYCAAFHITAGTLLNEFPNDLVWTYRQFPLVQIHPGSLKKSYTALCVKEKGNMDLFWMVTDYYMSLLLNSQ